MAIRGKKDCSHLIAKLLSYTQLKSSSGFCWSSRRTCVNGKWPLLPLHSPSHWPLTLIFVTFTSSPTSNQSRYWGGDRSKLLHVRDWNHPPLAFAVLCIPPLLFRLIPDFQDVSFLKGKIFFIIPIKVKEGSYILFLFWPENYSTPLPGSRNWFYQCCSVQIVYFVEFQ